MVVLLLSEERMRMLFPALRRMSLASTVLPLTAMSSLAMIAAVLPTVMVLPLASWVAVSLLSFHPVLPRLILIPTALFLLMALSVFWFFCMSLAFMPVCRAYGAFSLCIIYLFSNSKVIPSSFLSSISNPFLLSIYSFINFLSEA